MAEYIIQDTTLINIANAIRAKKGSSAKITPNNMVSEINSIVGAIEDVSTATAMDNKLISSNLGRAYRFIGTSTSNYVNGDIYIVEAN
jgi:hypothetical protein